MTRLEPSATGTSAPPERAATVEEASSKVSWGARFAERYLLIGAWLLLAAVFAVLVPGSFLQPSTGQIIFGSQAPLLFMAMGLMCTLLAGEFDLSVASLMGLSATLIPVLNVQLHVPIVLACLAGVAAACLAGAVNAFIVVILGVDAIITTLGTGTFVLGLTLWISNLQAVNGLSQAFSDIATGSVLGLPLSFYYGAAVTALMAFVLTSTPLGRHLLFVGSSREVARLAGIRVSRIRFGSYIASGLFCGLSGLILVATLGGFDPTTSQTYLLPTFAAVFLGAAAITPGRVNPIGTFIAIYFLATGILGLGQLGLTGWVQNVFYGAGLVIAVTASTIVRRHTAR